MLVEVHQLHHGPELQGLREPVHTVTEHDANEAVDPALAESEGVIARHTSGISHQEGPIRLVLHYVRHIFPETDKRVLKELCHHCTYIHVDRAKPEVKLLYNKLLLS